MTNYLISKERPIKRLKLYYDDDSTCLYGMELFDVSDNLIITFGWLHHGDGEDNDTIDIKLLEGQTITGFRSAGSYDDDCPGTHMHF